MNALLDRVGRFCARRHWAVVIVWLLVLAVLVLLRGTSGGTLANDYSVPGSQSQAGHELLQQDFPSQAGYAGMIVFHDPDGQIATQTAAIDTAMKNVAQLPHVVSSVSPFAVPDSPQLSGNGTTAYGTASWDVAATSLDHTYLSELDQAVAPARDAGLQVEYGGSAGQIGQITHDRTSEVIGLACALLLLVFMFGSILAAALPLVSAVCSVLAGLSVVLLLAVAIDFPTTAPTVATLLGLGVAVDYGLFLMARHREQLDHGMDVVESAGRSMATSGAAVVIAGGTVVVAILGLYVSGVPFVGALGLASAVVVAVAMLAALTILPAFMGVAGNNVRALKDRRAARRLTRLSDDPTAALVAMRRAGDQAHERSAFARWGRKVSDRPWPWAMAAVVVLALLCVPMTSMRLGQLDAGTNPTSDTIRRAYDLIDTNYSPGVNGPITVVVELPAGDSPQDDQDLLASTRSTLSATPGVLAVGTPAVNDTNTTAVVTVIPSTAPQDAATTALVDDLRTTVLPTVPAHTYLVGTTASYVDFTEKVSARMPWLILAVVALSSVLLAVSFRSLLIPVKAAVLNLLSVGAAYGVVVAVFQWGWGSSLVGIDEQLPIPAFVPMLMFAIIFGLSMDYEVFLLSRVHEAWTATKNAHRSVAIGIGSTARVITTAAAIMIAVFSSFVLDTDPTVKMLAIGMAAAVLIDASVIRMLLVPAVMSLLGQRAWWMPRWLDRVLPDLDIEGARHLAGPTSTTDGPAPAPDRERASAGRPAVDAS